MQLPRQIEIFFERQRFDLDVSQQMILSPAHTIVSMSEFNENVGYNSKLKRDSLKELDRESVSQFSSQLDML